jgi:hypothetical protein
VTTPPRCISCGSSLEAEPLGSPPSGGLLFYSRGSDESRVYSPYPGTADTEHLVIAVCDACLADAGDDGLVAYGTLYRPLGSPLPGTWEYTSWRLPDESGKEESSHERERERRPE